MFLRKEGLLMIASVFLISAILIFGSFSFLPTRSNAASGIIRGNASHAFGGGSCDGCTGGTFSSFFWSHTLASGSNFLVVGIFIEGTDAITSVTYGSQSMTRSATTTRTNIYYLTNPSSGTNTITVSLSSAVPEFGVVGQDYSGVDTSSPIDVKGTNSNTGASSIIVSVITTRDKDGAFLFVRDDSGTQNPGINSTTIFQSNNTNPPNHGFGAYDNQGHGDITPTGSWSMTVNRSSTSGGMEAAMITFSPTPPPPPPPSPKTLDDLFNQLQSILSKLDVALSTRASEMTLQGVKIGTDKLDTNLSTRASESTLADIKANIQTLTDGNNWQRATKSGKAFAVTTNKVVIPTAAETGFLLLKNPASSGKNIRMKTVLSSFSSFTGGTTLRIYRNPTIISDGSALTINNLKSSGPLSIAQAFKLPTFSVPGTLIDVFDTAGGAFVRDYDLVLFLEPNEILLVTFEPSKNNVGHSLTINFSEE